MPATDLPATEIAQPAAPVGGFDLSELGPPSISPAQLLRKGECKPSSGDEIVVCAQEDQEEFRLRELDQRFVDTLEPGEFRIAEGVVGKAELETFMLPGGIPSKRVMIRARLEF